MQASQGFPTRQTLASTSSRLGHRNHRGFAGRKEPAPCPGFLPGPRQDGLQFLFGGFARAQSTTAQAASESTSDPLPTTISQGGDSSDEAAPPAPTSSSTQEAVEEALEEAKSDEYSTTMNAKMGGSLHYRHELGINYNRILDDVIVGSCLQTAADVDFLAENEKVTTVFSLQEDCDMDYFNLDIKPIQDRCLERGDIRHVRFPVRDFDPQDLRRRLPKAIATLAKMHDPEEGTIYIHCTAGMGRAPGTALAYMYWLRGLSLDEAWSRLRAVRACNPKLEAVRGATADILLGLDPVPVTIGLHRHSSATKVQVAGLDVGWNTRLDLEWDQLTSRYVLHRTMQPGRYQYKFILDDHWSYSADHPTMDDGGNTNNWVEVSSHDMDVALLQKQTRLLQPGGDLTPEERKELASMLSPWREMPPADGPRFPMD